MNDELTLVDTNVLVHAYSIVDQRKHEQASFWLTRIWEGEQAATTLQNLSEFFFVVTRKVAKPLALDQAEAVVSGILTGSQWHVLDRNADTLLKAIELVKLHRASLWDALIAACMLEHRMTTIVTENERDYRFPRLYRRGPQLITSGARPAAQDLALTPVFTDGELPLD
jgi:predicted nucleic acid-binding protein